MDGVPTGKSLPPQGAPCLTDRSLCVRSTTPTYLLVAQVIGYVYAGAVLLGTSGAIVLIIRSASGVAASLAFLYLVVLWVTFFGVALYNACCKRIQDHKRWMIRHYALTWAAVTPTTRADLNNVTPSTQIVSAYDRNRPMPLLGGSISLLPSAGSQFWHRCARGVCHWCMVICRGHAGAGFHHRLVLILPPGWRCWRRSI